MRFIGMDVHRDACQVCIVDSEGAERQERIASRVDDLRRFAAGLQAQDVVAIEATGPAAAVARIIEPHAGQVVVVNPRRLGQIAARAKTDQIDARTLARLLAAGVLTGVWTPDEPTRALRRLVARRAAVVRARTRAKNEVHAVLSRNLCPRPPVTDAFGAAGRRWLEALELPEEEAITLAGCLRQIDALDVEVAELDRALARRLVGSPEARRLLSVPGVNIVVAATFLAHVGDVRRFPDARRLVGYLGLDPRVHQSGESTARGGHISKQGAGAVRQVLGQAAWRAARLPGPLRAFYERIGARRGPQVAATALARKLASLFWHLLTREEDYAFAMPSTVRRKRRALELAAGAAPHKGRSGPDGPWRPGPAQRAAEREVALGAEAAYRRMIADWGRTRGAGATTGERL
ncbi:IS110 family transposase [Miltoncostaea marina]|uniref:IS110 family transposase n=1 Tax=Miltoncostaea marina TaxID=2843215 RepID=UPI001C3E07A2|nr:IS110 family transposase [Miltoncostaea marina]